MIKIIGKAPYVARHEILDRTLDPEEAEFLLAEYRMAYGPGWSIELLPTRGQEAMEKVLELRAQGMTAGQIAAATGLDRFCVDKFASIAVRAGLIEKRKPGTTERLGARNERIIELKKAGVSNKAIGERLGMQYFTVRSMVYKLRKQGRL